MMQRLLLATCLLLASAAPAFTQSASTWFLAEGASNAFFDQDILVANPNTATISVTITLLPDPGASVTGPTTKTYLIGPTTRRSYNLKVEFPGLNGATSAQVSAVLQGTSTPANVIVERSMYFPDANRSGGHNASGVTATAERWILAEGASTIFNTFILVTNPNAEPVPVRVTYLRGGATPITFTETLSPNSRRTFWPQVEQPAALGSAEFSTIVESLTAGKEIVAERAMYFDYPAGPGFARSGHDALGVPAASTTWYFAEGNTGGNPAIAFETFLLLANQNATPTDVTVTYQLDTGEALSRVYTVPAQQRFTVWVDNEGLLFNPKLRNAAFGISVLATQPIVAERAMYWGTPSAQDQTTPSQPWAEGHATAGAPQRAAKWGFAEGAQDYVDATGIRYQTFVLLSNPNPTPIAVRATFLRSDGTGMQRDTCVPGNGRANIWTAIYPELSNQRFATFVETATTNAQGICGVATAGGEEFVAERAMYWRDGFTGGHANIGTPWTGTIATPPAPNFTLAASLAGPTSGRLSGGEWVDITAQNVAADVQVLFGGRPASAIQLNLVNGSGTIRAQTPVRTAATGYGNAGPMPVEVKSANRTATAGTFTFTFNVLAFGDSITYGVTNFYLGGMRVPVAINTPYPLETKKRLQATSQFGSYVRVTNAGWPGEEAIAFGETRLPKCLVGTSGGCLAPQNTNGYIPNPTPADFIRPFDVVVILEGINDVRTAGAAPSNVRLALQRMTQTAQANGVPVVMTRLTSYREGFDGDSSWLAPAAELNAQIWTLTEQLGLTRQSFDNIDMCPDGLHPTEFGYGQMGVRAADRIQAVFPSAPTP